MLFLSAVVPGFSGPEDVQNRHITVLEVEDIKAGKLESFIFNFLRDYQDEFDFIFADDELVFTADIEDEGNYQLIFSAGEREIRIRLGYMDAHDWWDEDSDKADDTELFDIYFSVMWVVISGEEAENEKLEKLFLDTLIERLLEEEFTVHSGIQSGGKIKIY